MSELPTWRWTTLGDECEIVSGSTPKTNEPEFWDGDIPWLTPADLSKWKGTYIDGGSRYITPKGLNSCSARLFPRNTVMMSSRAPIGYTAIANREMCTNQGFKSMLPSQSVDPEWLRYFLEHALPDIKAMASGTTFAEISGKKLGTLPMRLPPLGEQLRIVETLDDHLSRLDKALAEVNSALKKFEMLERSAMALHFTTSSESGSVNVVKIAEVTEKAKSLDPKSLGSESFKYVDIGSISPDSETPNVSEWTLTSSAPSRARQHIKLGDVVFSTVRPYQKKIAIVKEDLDGHIASTGFCVLRPIDGVLDTRYLFHYLKSDALMDQVLPLQRGASYPAVGDSDVKNSTIPVPDFAAQVLIAEELDAIVGIAKSLKSQLREIASTSDVMRRSILHSAFSGQLLEENLDW